MQTMYGKCSKKGFQATYEMLHGINSKTQLRVVGGTQSLPGTLPWQIEIVNKYDSDWVCGGTLVSSTKIDGHQKQVSNSNKLQNHARFSLKIFDFF